ncbi:hypothetical protein [Streptomyces canus]|uniref:hypothetical protein n=1 Tax=Streptomyces canus TaxID=58343 RepID=UPI003716FB21
MPTGKVRYDNLDSAVAQELGFNRAPVETERRTAFRSHFGIEVFYCRPGIEFPEVGSLAELNAMVDGWNQEYDARLAVAVDPAVRTAGQSRTARSATAVPGRSTRRPSAGGSASARTTTRCRCG